VSAVVVDTSILVDHLRGDERARTALRSAVRAGVRLTASAITKVEVLAGMLPSEERRTRLLLAQLTWIDVGDGIAERAGALAARWLKSHPGVGVADYVIAATAEELGAALMTRNVKHFPMIDGLRAPY
jgi:predicted nucleic acid-binding protein